MRRRGLNFYHRRNKVSASTIREVFIWLFGILLSILLAGVLVYTVGMKTSMIGVSMEPSLLNGQSVYINRFIYFVTNPQKDDVIVFLPNGNKNAHAYVKRVVGTPGDRLQIKDGNLYVNGEKQEERLDKIADPGLAENEIVLGQDEYFVMGDNCNNSEDSRSGNIGTVKKEAIIGKAWLKVSFGENGTIGIVK